MEQIFKETEPLGIKQRVKFFTDLFNILLNQLQINQIDISKLMKNSWTDFSDLNLSNPEEFKKMLFMKLDNILHSIKGDEEQPDSIIISHIKEYIHENYNKDITLEQIADHVFLSPVYVSRLFKEKTGENFSDYLVKVRMEKALKLLEEPRYKVYEVGYEIGYMSTKYFYKLFKKYYGCTPTEYRKNLFFLKRKGD
jgi:two-component system response regulator YesN